MRLERHPPVARSCFCIFVHDAPRIEHYFSGDDVTNSSILHSAKTTSNSLLPPASYLGPPGAISFLITFPPFITNFTR